MGEKLKLHADQFVNLIIAAYLHDVGKLCIPKEILNKPDRLTEEEFKVVKLHPLLGAIVLSSFSLPGVKNWDTIYNLQIIEAVLYHHEWYDGSGYPYGLKGKEIPLLARIISIADAYDAMTSPRPYRAISISKEKALAEILEKAGTQFDPIIAEVFVKAMESSEEITTHIKNQKTYKFDNLKIKPRI